MKIINDQTSFKGNIIFESTILMYTQDSKNVTVMKINEKIKIEIIENKI